MILQVYRNLSWCHGVNLLAFVSILAGLAHLEVGDLPGGDRAPAVDCCRFSERLGYF